MADADIRRRAGTPEQLPKGAAAALNEVLDALPPEQPSTPGAQPEPAPAPAEPGLGPVETGPRPRLRFQPTNEDEAFLFAPPDPAELQLAAQAAPAATPPERLRQLLPDLLEAAAHPTAPASLKLLARVLLDRLGG